MKSIPRIIHQTWKTVDIPEILSNMTETWKSLHPDWEYILWTDEMNREFISKNYSYFLPIYDNYTYNIQRADAVRYFILYHYGGLYVDLDFKCFKNIDILLEGRECVFGIEPYVHNKGFNRPYIICNAFMASTRKNDFLSNVCLNLQKASMNQQFSILDILETTGPLILTDVYLNYQNKESITLLPSEYIYPLTIEEVRTAVNKGVDQDTQVKLNNAYAVHYFWGSWL